MVKCSFLILKLRISQPKNYHKFKIDIKDNMILNQIESEGF